MKKTILFGCLLSMSVLAMAQTGEADAVKQTLNAYKKSIERLDTTGIGALFVANSKVFEQGSDEGTIGNYLGHHLAPELKDFKSFTFSDYKVDVNVAGNYAFTTESYIYTIVLAKDAKEIKSKGIATSVLQKVGGNWKIVQTHSSFRRATPPPAPK